MHTDYYCIIFVLPALMSTTPSYTNEPSVKLLSVDFFAERFPAKDSQFRVEMDGGEDVPADLDPLEEANDMPDQYLILRPGGHAVYQLPVNRVENQEEMYLMVKPGKKDVESPRDFKDKADIELTATVAGYSKHKLCSVLPNDGSSEASDYCVLNITPFLLAMSLEVIVETPASETRNASIWEIWLSPVNDSRKAKGTFDNDGRQRLRRTQKIPEFNTWLTLTSIVGKTGVGKSTIASFLAGNVSMFTSESTSTSVERTTIGTDISPIIPSQDYISVMADKLQEGDIEFTPDLYQPDTLRPLFFLDSEGMSFFGDEFDFITSGPAAIIAKMIVWITADRMRPVEILNDIKEYMNGLDRISMGKDDAPGSKEYGQFVILMNKMQNVNKTDEELLDELMGFTGDDEQIETIENMKERFQDISVVGLPLVHVEEGEELDFSVLPVRFREGLNKIANKVLHGIENPRNFKVGNLRYEMNATEAVTIVSMMINAANQGNIDLTDSCNVLFTIKKEEILEEINTLNEEIYSTIGESCNKTTFGVKCRNCICPYRNNVITYAVEALQEYIKTAVADAQQRCDENPSVAEQIENLGQIVKNWEEKEVCTGTFVGNDDPNVCDISEMAYSNNGSRVCDSLFICGETVFPDIDLNIEVKRILFIDTVMPKITITPPPKAESGATGKDGYSGKDGKNFILNATDCTLVPGSGSFLSTNLTGGSGGDGGNGPVLPPIPPSVSCSTVHSHGSYHCCSERTCTDSSGDRHCSHVPYIYDCEGFWAGDCYGGHEDKKTYKYSEQGPANCPSDLSTLDGGNGGTGGNPGRCQIIGLNVECLEEPGQTNGGHGGKAGYGKKQTFDVFAIMHFATGYWKCCVYDWAQDECCQYGERYTYCDSPYQYTPVGTAVEACHGQDGLDG